MKLLLRIGLGLVLLLAVGVGVLAALGSTIPREHEAMSRVDLDRPPAEVYAILLDVQNYTCWRTGLEKVEVVGDDPLRIVEYADNGTIPYRFELAAPNEALLVHVDDPELPWGGTWEHTLEPNGQGTRLTTTERGYVDSMLLRGLVSLIMDPHDNLVRFHHDLVEYGACGE